jgi:hypothetical protein
LFSSPQVQKLLFSATLSQNPETLQQLNLFLPKLFTTVVIGTKTASHVQTEAMTGEQATGTGAGIVYNIAHFVIITLKIQ